MKIDYLSLKNYRQYQDQKIDFPVSGEKRATIIQGVMGTGKTNILNAITWCLYGKEPHIGNLSKALPLVSTLTLAATREGQLCEVTVEIQLSREKQQYRIRRTAVFKKGPDGTPPTPQNIGEEKDGSKLQVWATIGKNVGYFRNPSLAVQRLVPEDIYEYFFFDGEKLDQYFREEAAQKVQEAVFKISQLELLDRIVDHLDDATRTMLRKSKDLTPRSQEILDKIELENDSLKNEKQAVDNHLAEKRKGDDAQRELENKILHAKVPDIKEKKAEADSRRKRVESNQDQLEDVQTQLSTILVESSPQILSVTPVTLALDMISKEKDAGELPPDIKRDYLANLLKKGVCICGEDIRAESSPHRKQVKALLDKCEEITNISTELFDLHRTLGSIRSDVKQFPAKYVSLCKRENILLDQIREDEEAVKAIEEKIKSAGNEDVTHWQEQLEEYRRKLADINGQIALGKDVCSRLEASITSLRSELQTEMGKEQKRNSLNERKDLSEKALAIAQKVKSEIMSETRKSIEERTRKQFKDLIIKKETYKDLTIDDQYNIMLRDQSGLPAIGSLSAGEREVLALSFIESLSIVSGFDAPIIIDTPLGRISNDPTVNIAEGLPSFFEGKQLVLLVTDKEYSTEVRKQLAPIVSHEYKIKWEESKSGSKSEVV